jgi:peroxiredoxin
MKRWIAVSVAAMCVSAATVRAESLALGATAPKTDVKMKNVDGKELSIADVKGEHGTLVIFSCNHCPFVKAWETRIASIGNTYRKKGFGVIAINSNDPAAIADDNYEEMQKRAKDRGFEFPYVVDATSGMARAFGATKTPEAFVFDSTGKLVYHGAIDDDKDGKNVTKNFLRDALDAVLAGKDVTVKETKAIGCGIKLRKA